MNDDVQSMVSSCYTNMACKIPEFQSYRTTTVCLNPNPSHIITRTMHRGASFFFSFWMESKQTRSQRVRGPVIYSTLGVPQHENSQCTKLSNSRNLRPLKHFLPPFLPSFPLLLVQSVFPNSLLPSFIPSFTLCNFISLLEKNINEAYEHCIKVWYKCGRKSSSITANL